MDVGRQLDGRRPGVQRIDRRAGPVDADFPLGQPGELLGQEQRPRGPAAGVTMPPENSTNRTSSANAASKTCRAAV